MYSNSEFNALAKIISHKSSKKDQKGYNKWLYPDMVAVNFEYDIYHNTVLQFAKKFTKIPLKIYFFEIKKEINIGNFREYYFQAVSNLSWANYGYLVALNIDESDNELIELINKLNVSFDIGVLSLSSDDISQSKPLAIAKFKESVDFNILNELCRKNPNFKDFLNTINDYDITKPERFKGEFDKILSQIEIEKYLQDKNIL